MRHDDNLTAERPTFVTHLECSATGERYDADRVHNLSRAGKPLLVRYDLDGVKRAFNKEALARRPADFWRYRELLPVRRTADIVSRFMRSLMTGSLCGYFSSTNESR